jgi:hypothetical protein
MSFEQSIASLLKAIEELPRAAVDVVAPTMDSQKSDLELFFGEQDARRDFYNQRLCDLGNILVSRDSPITEHPEKQKLLDGFGILLDELRGLSLPHYLSYLYQLLSISEQTAIDPDFRQFVREHYVETFETACATIKNIVQDDAQYEHLPKVIYFFVESKRLGILDLPEFSNTKPANQSPYYSKKAQKIQAFKILGAKRIRSQR